MLKPFTPQPELFVSSANLNHPALHALDNTHSFLIGHRLNRYLFNLPFKQSASKPSAANIVSQFAAGDAVSFVRRSAGSVPTQRLIDSQVLPP